MSKPSLRDAFNNFWSYDAPLGARVKMLVRNNMTKVRTRSNCCGNHGQPGC